MVENTSKWNQNNLNLVYTFIKRNFVFSKCLDLYLNVIEKFGVLPIYRTFSKTRVFEERSIRVLERFPRQFLLFYYSSASDQ